MFEVNVTTLQLLKTQDTYAKVRAMVNAKLFDPDVKRMIAQLDNYWRDYPEHTRVMPDVFMTELELNNPDLSTNDLQLYQGMLTKMMDEPDPAAAQGLVRSLRTLEFAEGLERINHEYAVGNDIDIYEATKTLCEVYGTDVRRVIDLAPIPDSIGDILADAEGGVKLPWFLNCLSGAMPNIRTGMQIIFAARPGKGKTSFCAANAVHLAAVTPGGRPVLWFNNEGKGRVIKSTVYRAALGSTLQEISLMGADEATRRYSDIVGAPDRIRIFDIHGRDYRLLERIIAEQEPQAVIFDMLDNVKGFNDAARTDLRLEQLYQWARECAVRYDFLSIPTSQLSVEAEGLAWCDQSMLKDSKTAKQGACDAIVTMGAVNNPEQYNVRYLYVPKNKQEPLKGSRADCYSAVYFNGPSCKFTEAGEPGVKEK